MNDNVSITIAVALAQRNSQRWPRSPAKANYYRKLLMSTNNESSADDGWEKRLPRHVRIKLYRDGDNEFIIRVEWPNGSHQDHGPHQMLVGDTFTVILGPVSDVTVNSVSNRPNKLSLTQRLGLRPR